MSEGLSFPQPEKPGPLSTQIVKLATVLRDVEIGIGARKEAQTLDTPKANNLTETATKTIKEIAKTNRPLANLLEGTLLSTLYGTNPSMVFLDISKGEIHARNISFLKAYYAIMRVPNDPVFALGKTWQLKERVVRARNTAMARGDFTEAKRLNNLVIYAYEAEEILKKN